MKCRTGFAAAFAMLLISGIAVNAATLAPTGQNKLVEWQVEAVWDLSVTPKDMVYSLDAKYVYILTDDGRVQIFDTQGKLQGAIPVGKEVVSIDISPHGDKLFLIDSANNSFSSVAISFVRDIDITGSPFHGRADAPVTVAVFTDFE